MLRTTSVRLCGSNRASHSQQHAAGAWRMVHEVGMSARPSLLIRSVRHPSLPVRVVQSSTENSPVGQIQGSPITTISLPTRGDWWSRRCCPVGVQCESWTHNNLPPSNEERGSNSQGHQLRITRYVHSGLSPNTSHSVCRATVVFRYSCRYPAIIKGIHSSPSWRA